MRVDRRSGECRRFTVALTLMGAVAGPVGAQETAQPVGLEVVVVTAQKRAESLQDVPVSIAAFTSADLEARNITNFDHLAQYTPGLSAETAGSSRPFYYLRGYGTGSFDVQSDPAIAIYVDEVYSSRFSATQMNLFDIERVEVLKGPQGTLFGRNAAGGAISVITKKPSDEFEGNVGVDFSDYSAITARAAVGGPVSEHWKARLNVGWREREGYVTENTTGQSIDDQSSAGGRLQLLWEPSDRVSALIAAEISRDRDGPWAQRNVTNAIFTIPPARRGLFSPNDPDFYRVTYDVIGHQDRDNRAVSARVDYDSGAFTLTYLGSFRNTELDELQDDDSSNARAFSRAALEDSDQMSHELRITSQDTGRWRSVAGLYYFNERAERTDRWTLGQDRGPGGLPPQVQSDAIRVDTDSYAAFAQATYAATSRLDLTLGARYTSDRKSSDRDVVTATGAYQLRDLTAESDSFDPVVSVDFKATETILLYASWRNGYRGGGYQPAIPASAALASRVFDPEDVEAFEAGIKADLLDSRLRVNAAAFHTKLSDLQVLQGIGVGPAGPITVTLNAAQATSQGLELDVTALLTEALQLNAGYAYTDATFDQFIDSTGANLAGKHQQRVPENQYNAALTYELSAGADRRLSFGAEWSYRSKMYYDFSNLESMSQAGYDMVNLRAGLSLRDGRVQLRAYVQNVTDEEVCKNILPLANNTVGLCTMGTPRTYGAGINWNFGGEYR